TGRNARKRVLTDHKKVGKRFVPPLVATLSNLTEASWVKVTLPETIWIACLHWFKGARGPELAHSLAAAALEARAVHQKAFVAVSDYTALSTEQRAAVLSRLKEVGHLDEIRSALAILHTLYPGSPFGFLFYDGFRVSETRDEMVERFKPIVERLFDKT